MDSARQKYVGLFGVPLSLHSSLRSRIRRPIVVFEPVREVEIATYYAAAAGLKLDLKTATLLSKRASGGFRTVANEAQALVNIANASGLPTITEEMIKQL